MYASTSYGPGNIAALQSGVGLTQGPTIGSNDPTSAMSAGGRTAAYNIPPVSGCCGMGWGHGTPTPLRGLGEFLMTPVNGLGSLLGLGECDEGCRKWAFWGVVAVIAFFGVSFVHDKYKTTEGPLHY